MKSPLFKFFLILSGLSIFIASILYTTKGYKNDLVHDSFPAIIIFFFILTLIAFLITMQGLKNRKDFHNYYFLSIAVRLPVCIIFVFIFINFSSNNPILFVVNFFVLYFIYTSFEIYFLLRNLRAD